MERLKDIAAYLSDISTTSLKKDKEVLLFLGKILKFGDSDELIDSRLTNTLEKFFNALYREIEEGNKKGLDEVQKKQFEKLRSETMRLARMKKDKYFYTDYYELAPELGKKIINFAKSIKVATVPFIISQAIEQLLN